MKSLIIRRVTTGIKGTKGVIVFENDPFALSLEREWLDNAPSISCIPSGEYTCKRVDSPKFGNTFEVTNVPFRTHILFHKGNVDSDSQGCILVGEEFGDLGNDTGVLNSKHGYDELMAIMSDDDEFRLVIVDDWKTSLTNNGYFNP